MKKLFFLFYGVVCYLIFFGTFLYLIGFVENLLVPKTIDFDSLCKTKNQLAMALVPENEVLVVDDNFNSLNPLANFQTNPIMLEIEIPTFLKIIINLLLILLFGLQHSIMARKGFKDWITRYIPQPIERSTYVLIASLILTVMFLFWQPISTELWNFSGQVTGNILLGISFLGWGLVLLSTFLINHFHLFGLYQVYQNFREKQLNDTFKMPFLYKLVRHPLYLGFLIAFWFAPVMTVGHLLFSSAMTVYILIGIHHEEKDLVRIHGDSYKQYREETPKLIPFTKNK
jgi:methanethiol S-methyltransferase